MRQLSLAALGLIGTAAFAQDVDRASLPKNVLIEDGKQIVEILAKGSYIPQRTAAKANIPTTIKIYTQATFDCTLALTIPSLGYRKMLPRTGETLIEIPAQKEGAELQGVCSMAMYNFLVTFN
jgi:plastocyanin domain-containing protein